MHVRILQSTFACFTRCKQTNKLKNFIVKNSNILCFLNATYKKGEFVYYRLSIGMFNPLEVFEYVLVYIWGGIWYDPMMFSG